MQFQANVDSLQTQINKQNETLRAEKVTRQQAENNMMSSKTQQSKMAKERNELEIEVNKLRDAMGKAESRIETLGSANAKLTNDNRLLQVTSSIDLDSTGISHRRCVLMRVATKSDSGGLVHKSSREGKRRRGDVPAEVSLRGVQLKPTSSKRPRQKTS